MIYSGRSLHRVPSRWWSRCFRSDCQYENFSFFKKGLAVDYSYDYFCEVVLVSILSLLRVSVNIPRPFSPHIYHLKEQRVKKKKNKAFFSFFFSVYLIFFFFPFFPLDTPSLPFPPCAPQAKSTRRLLVTRLLIIAWLHTFALSLRILSALCFLPFLLVGFYNLFPGLHLDPD